MTLQKVIKNRPLFPSDEAVLATEKYQQSLDNADTELEWRDEPICDFIREPAAKRQHNQQLVYTNFF